MSGTSMDGIDLSVISSDGYNKFSNILDDYYEYDKKLQDQLVRLRDVVLTKKDLLRNSEKLRELERNLTLFHANAVNQSLKKYRNPIDLIVRESIICFSAPSTVLLLSVSSILKMNLPPLFFAIK